MPKVLGIDANDDEEEIAEKIHEAAQKPIIYKEDIRIIVTEMSKTMTPSKGSGLGGGSAGIGKKPTPQKRPLGGAGGGQFGRPKMGGGFAPKKPIGGGFGKPKMGAATSGLAKQAPSEIGANPLTELKLEAEETMIQECEDEDDDEIENATVAFLPQDRDALYNNDFRLKFEYGFKEKAKAAKLRGGNGPKEPKKKKESNIINLGEGGAAAEKKPSRKELK